MLVLVLFLRKYRPTTALVGSLLSASASPFSIDRTETGLCMGVCRRSQSPLWFGTRIVSAYTHTPNVTRVHLPEPLRYVLVLQQR